MITVTLNDLHGLKIMAESLGKQTYSNYEHIIIDGGSRDGTAEWLRQNGSGGNVSWTSEPDKGIFDAMNKGARKASGDLLVFLNSGDKFFDSDTLRFVADDWTANEWRWAFGEVSFVDDAGVSNRITNQHDFNARRLRLGLQFTPHPATYFERTFFEELNGFDTRFKFAADQEFAMRASSVSPPATWPRVLADFLMGGVHSQASFKDREMLYHQMRQKNSCLFMNSRALDSTYTVSMVAYRSLRKRAGEFLRARGRKR